MAYKWKQTIFKPEDFDGVGHYLESTTFTKC